MTQQKLQRTAHFISLLLNVGAFVLKFFSVLMAIGLFTTISIALFFPEWLHNTLTQSAVSLSLFQVLFFFFCCLGILICLAFALSNAKIIFKCISYGQSPFTKDTAHRIKKIAGYVMLYAVLAILSVFKIDIPSFIITSLFALILFCVALIFDYGCQLQQEIDETL